MRSKLYNFLDHPRYDLVVLMEQIPYRMKVYDGIMDRLIELYYDEVGLQPILSGYFAK